MRLDSHRDGTHAFPITRLWAEVNNGVDAVFSFSDKIYMIKVGWKFLTRKTFFLKPNKIPTHSLFFYTLQDDKVYIYKTGAHYTLVEGYPKTLNEELGIEGHVDAAFACPNENVVHIVQGGWKHSALTRFHFFSTKLAIKQFTKICVRLWLHANEFLANFNSHDSINRCGVIGCQPDSHSTQRDQDAAASV